MREQEKLPDEVLMELLLGPREATRVPVCVMYVHKVFKCDSGQVGVKGGSSLYTPALLTEAYFTVSILEEHR